MNCELKCASDKPKCEAYQSEIPDNPFLRLSFAVIDRYCHGVMDCPPVHSISDYSLLSYRMFSNYCVMKHVPSFKLFLLSICPLFY